MSEHGLVASFIQSRMSFMTADVSLATGITLSFVHTNVDFLSLP